MAPPDIAGLDSQQELAPGGPQWAEADRLAALQSYGILDTPRETAFDDIVAIASHVCNSPIAVVNLIADGRQWFKAEIGLGVRETPLASSICAHALLEAEILVVPDTTKDPRFACNALVTGAPHLRFYAGALLLTPEGLPLGTVCVLDTAPRPGLTVAQAQTLLSLARQVMVQFELKRLLRQATISQGTLTQHLLHQEQALQEKDLLMQEIHHRVKNSLQLVQNLLSLQARASNDEVTREVLGQSSARIHTISAMHDRLYRSGTALSIDVKPYLEDLTRDLQTSLASNIEGRNFHLDAVSAIWPAADVPTLGLVMTELVTNALKYGEGLVRIRFHQRPGEQAILTVEDEGNALPDDFDASKSRGLGMRLVTGLLKPRGGGFEVVRGAGHTCFRATFPRNMETA